MRGHGRAWRFRLLCRQTTSPAGIWSFGYDAGGAWQIAVLHEVSGPVDSAGFNVDGHRSGLTGWAEGLQVVCWLDPDENGALAQGSLLQLDLPGKSYKWPLTGTGAAALKVKEYVDSRGVPPAAAPAPAVTQGGLVDHLPAQHTGAAWPDHRGADAG